MATLLITFLGRVPKAENGYRTTRYDFGDSQPEAPTAFFGWSLQRRLRPDQMVILGTSGSMWDHLFEDDPAFGAADETALALLEAVESKAVSATHLNPLVPLLEQRLACRVHLGLIPYARTTDEQVALLQIMAEHVNKGDQVHLDVTHGLRHLPMLAILAALHLRSVREAEIAGIWYGAFDPDTNKAPVHELSGLMHIADWLAALHTYDKDGDYGVFAPLLGSAGQLLAEAAYFERTSNPVKARERLSSWASRPNRVPADDPAAALFSDELHQRICWYRGTSRAQWERALALEYLNRGDWVRSAIYGMESVISARVATAHGDVDDFPARDNARLALKQDSAFKRLEHLRNALAHGVRPFNQQVLHILSQPDRLARALREALQALG